MLNWPGAKRKAACFTGSVKRNRSVKMVGDSWMRSTTSASSGRCGLSMRAPAANGRGFLGNIYADRTPRDAASAAHATAAAVLVMPAPELVRQPLAVARSGIGTDRNTVNVAVSLGETGIPLAYMQAATAVERGLVRLAVAKTGRTYRGAIAA